MAIEAIDENVQTQLVTESREEKLTRLFNLDMEIQTLTVQKSQANAEANSLNNSIKKKNEDRIALLNIINSGQGTVVPVAVETEAEGDDEDGPTDDELEGFMDPEEEAPEGEEDTAPAEGEDLTLEDDDDEDIEVPQESAPDGTESENAPAPTEEEGQPE